MNTTNFMQTVGPFVTIYNMSNLAYHRDVPPQVKEYLENNPTHEIRVTTEKQMHPDIGPQPCYECKCQEEAK